MAKNRALTLKKAHQRREKIQSALLDKSDFLYIKDIADLCGMQTVDISNDLKEMTRLGLLSKKEDKTAHPKRLMYKLKPVAAARLVKESKAATKKDAVKPAAPRQDSGAVAEKAEASAPASKTKPSKTTVSKNGKSASSKASSPKPSSETGAAKSTTKPTTKTAAKSAGQPTVAKQKSGIAKTEESKSIGKAASKSTAKVAASAASAKEAKTSKSAKSVSASKTVKAAPPAKNAKVETSAKKAVAKKVEQISAPVVPAPRKRAASGATQGQILAELAKGQALSIEALCQRLNKQTANMYKMVGSLYAQGQIQKHKNSGRGFVYSLTGSSAPAPVVASAKPVSSKAKAASTASEAELLDNLIDKLAGAAKGFLRSLIRA